MKKTRACVCVHVCQGGAFRCIRRIALLTAFSGNGPPPPQKRQVAYSHLIGHDTAIHLTELKNPTYAYAGVS